MLKNPQPEIQRDDGTVWEASYKSEGSAMACLFNRSLPSLYFRELIANPRRTWWRWWEPEYLRTGKTWEGHNFSDGGFDVIKPQAARC